eukprot:TRINITY_DN38112_c0_g1_i1.p1 TRINITY_DN38112_c0_g1~~TRINITY_DN38112_c0_g1_i1.p1  ORF type:complete len:241 (+),score=19.93 TRINITY_DN38112_c0_g1_i1:51-773(+)
MSGMTPPQCISACPWSLSDTFELDASCHGEEPVKCIICAAEPTSFVTRVKASGFEIAEVFSAPVYFTRWLFKQPRGLVEQRYVLITGWREATPCANAIKAVVTGNLGWVRSDGQRPPLTPVTRNCCLEESDENAHVVRSVIRALIVPVEPAQVKRARNFASRNASSFSSMVLPKIYICAAKEEVKSTEKILPSDCQSRVHTTEKMLLASGCHARILCMVTDEILGGHAVERPLCSFSIHI